MGKVGRGSESGGKWDGGVRVGKVGWGSESGESGTGDGGKSGTGE